MNISLYNRKLIWFTGYCIIIFIFVLGFGLLACMCIIAIMTRIYELLLLRSRGVNSKADYATFLQVLVVYIEVYQYIYSFLVNNMNELNYNWDCIWYILYHYNVSIQYIGFGE